MVDDQEGEKAFAIFVGGSMALSLLGWSIAAAITGNCNLLVWVLPTFAVIFFVPAIIAKVYYG